MFDEENFFFDQPRKKFTRRPRKDPSEIPPAIRYTHLQPKMAEFLTTNQFISDRSLPAISKHYIMVKRKLDITSSFDDSSSRFLYEEIEKKAPNILNQLSRFLYNYEDIDRVLPNGLRYQLKLAWRDLTNGVIVVHREWQTVAMKENYQLQMSLKAAMDEDEYNSTSFVESRESSVPSDRSTSQEISYGLTKRGALGRHATSRSNLPEINEEGERRKKSPSIARRSVSNLSRMSKHSMFVHGKLHGPKSTLSDIRSRCGDSRQTLTEVDSDPTPTTIANEARSFYSVINFIYSSKQTEERGWLIKKESEIEMELRPTLEWCLTVLRGTIRNIKLFRNTEKEHNRLFPPLYKFCTPVSAINPNAHVRKQVIRKTCIEETNLFPTFPSIEPQPSQEKLLRTAVTDGTAIIYYESGHRAIVKSHAGTGRVGFYVLVYNNTSENKLMAIFTPSGSGSCYHSNGNVSFFCNESGGHHTENNSSITTKWRWPTNCKKLASPVVIQLNQIISLRVFARDQMHIFFQQNRDVLRVSVAPHPNYTEPQAHDEKNDLMMTHYAFSSKLPTETHLKLSVPPTGRQSSMKIAKKKRDSSIWKEKTKPHIAEVKKIFAEETSSNDFLPDRELARLQQKVRGLVDDWQEHYRIAIGIPSELTVNMADKPKAGKKRNAFSAKALYTNTVRSTALNNEDAIMAEAKINAILPRNPSAPAAIWRKSPRTSVPSTTKSHRRETLASSSQGKVATTLYQHPLTRVSKPTNFACTVSLRTMMLGHGRQPCRCNHHFLAVITDVEYTRFIMDETPQDQLIVVFVTSSLFPMSNGACETMLLKIHAAQAKQRVHGCEGARMDSFRILRYDVATAAAGSTHTQPLLLTQHNVVPGMFLMYLGGDLLFCDHIFNGYGNTRQDFRKQISQCRHDAAQGKVLPPDFKFSPIKGRTGMRSAFGGEMGGAGVDHYGGVGTSTVTQESGLSRSSSCTTNSLELALEAKVNPHDATPAIMRDHMFEMCLNPHMSFKDSPRQTVIAS